MTLEELKRMMEKAKTALDKSFSDMLESASDDNVKTYETQVKTIKALEAQIKEAEAIEEMEHKKKVENKKTGNRTLTEEEATFVSSLKEAVAKGNKFNGLLPRTVANQIQKRKETIAKVRGFCSVHQATGDYTIYVGGDTVTVSYVSEGAAIPETDPTITPIGLTALKLGCLIKVSNEYLNDLGVDVLAYIVEEMGKAFARKEDEEILFGAGTATSTRNNICGIVPNADATKVITAKAADTVTWEEVKKTIQAIGPYRSSAHIFCSQAFLDICHSFKDGSTYMFPQNQAITSLMGVPVTVSDAFKNIDKSTPVMIVGDFSYYHIADRAGISITTLNELYAATDQTGIRGIERIDGAMAIKEAFAVLKTAAA